MGEIELYVEEVLIESLRNPSFGSLMPLLLGDNDCGPSSVLVPSTYGYREDDDDENKERECDYSSGGCENVQHDDKRCLKFLMMKSIILILVWHF